MTASSKNSAPRQSNSPGHARKLPPLKALLAFEAASRRGSFALGAEELRVTPSAVSHHIQQMENFLGVKLFHRQAGRALLTSVGQTYAAEIEQAFVRIAEATDLVAPKPVIGQLVIASGPSFAAKWLQPRIPDFLLAHPGIKVRLTTLSGADDLDLGDYDVAVSYGRPAQLDRAAHPLLTERLRPVCSPALAASLDLRRPQDLSRATLIHSKNALTWTDYLTRLGHAGLRAADELWLDRSSMAIEAAVDDLGVVLESELLTQRELLEGRLVAPFDDFACSIETESYFLVKPRRTRSGTRYSAFEHWIRAALETARCPISPAPARNA